MADQAAAEPSAAGAASWQAVLPAVVGIGAAAVLCGRSSGLAGAGSGSSSGLAGAGSGSSSGRSCSSRCGSQLGGRPNSCTT